MTTVFNPVVSSSVVAQKIEAPVKKPPSTSAYTFTLNGAFARSLSTGTIKDWAKLVRYITFYVGEVMTNAPAFVSQVGVLMGNTKNVLSIGSLYNGILKTNETFCGVIKPSFFGTAIDTMVEVGGCFGNVVDIIEVTLASGVPFHAATSTFVKKLNPGVTGLCASVKTIKSVYKWAEADEVGKADLSFLNLAMQVSYVAFAAISLGCTMVIGVAPSSFAIVTCLASATLFGLAAFFYEMMYDPYCKNYETLIGRAKLAA